MWGMGRIRDVENQNPACTSKFSIGQLVVVGTRYLGWSLSLKGKQVQKHWVPCHVRGDVLFPLCVLPSFPFIMCMLLEIVRFS